MFDQGQGGGEQGKRDYTLSHIEQIKMLETKDVRHTHVVPEYMRAQQIKSMLKLAPFSSLHSCVHAWKMKTYESRTHDETQNVDVFGVDFEQKHFDSNSSKKLNVCVNS